MLMLNAPHVLPRSHTVIWLVVLGAAVALGPVLFVGGARSATEATGLIAFTRWRAVYVMHADGTDARPVWRGPRGATDVAWSPDGTKLVFGTPGAIVVMNANGSDRVRVADVTARSLAWSADGRIAFTAHRGSRDADIWLMYADGSNMRRLRRTPRISESNVDWSPAGDRLAFDTGWGELYVVKENGRSLRNLTPKRGAWSGEPDWSSDGREIAFAYADRLARHVGPAPYTEIWVMDASGELQLRLTENKVRDGSPTWSPDGQRIAFLRERHLDAYGMNWFVNDIYVMNANGTGARKLSGDGRNLAWQPVPAS
jgi:TolB protein